MTRVPTTETGNSAARDTACDPIGLSVNPEEHRANRVRLRQMDACRSQNPGPTPRPPQRTQMFALLGGSQAGQPLQIPIDAVDPPQPSPAIWCLSASPTPANAARHSILAHGVRETCIVSAVCCAANCAWIHCTRQRRVGAVEGMADQRICYANLQPTRNLPAQARLEQGAYRRPEASACAETRLAIRVRLEIAENVRDLALFNVAIDSKLRGCDLVTLRVADVYAAG